MKTTRPRLTRLKMQVKLFQNDKQVFRTTKHIKSKVVSFVQGIPRSEWQFGTCRVWYSLKNEYWNEFRFETIDELKHNLAIDTEWALVREFI